MMSTAYTIMRALVLGAVVFFAAGCAGQKEVVQQQSAALDSLSAENRALHSELSVLRDSLQFFDDIDSGQYFRDRRLLTQQIDALRYDVSVCIDGGRTVKTLLVDELFKPASADLTEGGRSALGPLADSLRQHFVGRQIRIEGHSDSTPIGSSLREKYPSNWELSADRAAAVVRFFVDEEGLPAGQIESVSFGASRPTAKNDTAQGRRLNRRIRVAVMPP